MKTELPENEAERLNALRRYEILDTPPEPAFDRIAEMAANFFHVPMAGVSLVDEDRVWFKSRVGINVHQTARDAGLCSSAMLSQGVYHLSDAAHDQRALGHSFVADLGIRFYAAAPLRTHESLNLGTVWVLDQKPRELAPEEAEMLRTLAALAMNQIELRRQDDGRPLWVRWWAAPYPEGGYTRSMFMDISDQVRMEQEKARLEAQNAYLLDEIRTEQSFGDIVGGSSRLRKVMQQVQLVAPTDATVLITGESGTGKELVARAIHEQSARERPLIK